MSQGLRLELRQSQQLVMTPQLQQAIRLLQYSNLELTGWLEGECERNPLLSLDPGEAADEAPDPPPPADADGPDIEPDNAGVDGEEAAFVPPRHAGLAGTGGPAAADGFDLFEDRLSETPTLRAHLHAQLGQMRADPTVRLVAGALVEMLDEHGMLRDDTGQLSARLGVPADTVGAALRLIQCCEPTGVGARSLAECLGLQLAERNRLDPAMQTLLDNLDMLARGEQQKLRRLCGVAERDFAGMLAELRALDPRPCAGFDVTPAETLVPDVLVRRGAWGGWRIELNPDTLPRVLVDQDYAAELERGGAEARRFVADCRADANWLVKSLEQRARTILKVATEIVRRQERFFEEGVTGLQPLTLRMVADAIGMHESTASRVTANKYMATERGVFELRFFFGNAVGGAGADGIAASSVRHRIRSMIDAERPDAILSDDTIVEALGREGIDIARRTVAKYRKLLSIPSSVDRRRQKAMSLQS